MNVLVVGALVFVPMLIEAVYARRNERAQRTRGGVEPAGDVYPVMRVGYPAAFLAMIVEGWWRGGGASDSGDLGVKLFLAAKALKWWAIATLGQSWTLRVIVVPGAPLVRTGPYRFMRHPNYVAVAGELTGVALMTRAVIAGPLVTAWFVWLMLKRIAVEERALNRGAHSG
jgi:methyltransferase